MEQEYINVGVIRLMKLLLINQLLQHPLIKYIAGLIAPHPAQFEFMS